MRLLFLRTIVVEQERLGWTATGTVQKILSNEILLHVLVYDHEGVFDFMPDFPFGLLPIPGDTANVVRGRCNQRADSVRRRKEHGEALTFYEDGTVQPRKIVGTF